MVEVPAIIRNGIVAYAVAEKPDTGVPQWTYTQIATRYDLGIETVLAIVRESAHQAGLASRRNLAKRCCHDRRGPAISVVHGNYADVCTLEECFEWRMFEEATA